MKFQNFPRRVYGSFVVALLIFNLVGSISGLRFYLSPNHKRCVKEEMRKDATVVGDFEMSETGGVRTDLSVTDSKGHVVYHRENSNQGKFALTSDDDDIFDFCFTSYLLQGAQVMPEPRQIKLEMKHGVESKDYTNLANVQKLKPLEVEMQKLEDLSASVLEDFNYMERRKREIRDTNESTTNFVFYLGIISMFCPLGLAVGQISYLRRFFKAKKLID